MRLINISILLPLLLNSINSSAEVKENLNKAATIKIKMEDAALSDTFTLVYYEHAVIYEGNRNISSKRLFSTMNENGCFNFVIDSLDGPCYFSIGKDRGTKLNSIWYTGKNLLPNLVYILDLYLIEPGDNITINIVKDFKYKNLSLYVKKNDEYFSGIYNYKDFSIYFSGKGSNKYNCRYQADRVSSYDTGSLWIVNPKNLLYNTHNSSNKSLNSSLDVLKRYQSQLSPLIYNLIKADFIGKYKGDEYFSFRMFLRTSDFDSSEKRKASHKFVTVANPKSNIPTAAQILSFYYSRYLIEKKLAAHFNVSDSILALCYYQLKDIKDEKLRDKVLAKFIFSYWMAFKSDFTWLVQDALRTISMNYCFDIIESFYNSRAVGRKAWNFSLPDLNNRKVSLSDFKGKVVLLDFWYRECGACIEYYVDVLKDIHKRYKNNTNIVFISISIDSPKTKWLRSVNDGKYTSTDAINLYTEDKGQEHPVIKEYMVFGYPHPVLIDKEGKIASSSDNELRNAEELVKKIDEALKAKSF